MKESLKEQEAKITEMMRGPVSGGAKMAGTPAPDDNPRK